MNRVVVNAWFCDKCHAYHKMKQIPVPMKSGSTFKVRVECRKCGKVQHEDVIVDYWGAKRGKIIDVNEGEGMTETSQQPVGNGGE